MVSIVRHYGVRGQKWGVRKDKRSGRSVSSRPASKMSDKELQQAVSRLQMERSYSRLLSDKDAASNNTSGAKMVSDHIGKMTLNAATTVGVKAMKRAMQAGLDKAIDAGKTAILERATDPNR